MKNRDFISELRFSSSRSSGPGGQNVNKVNSKVELRFNVGASQLLTAYEKFQIRHKLKNRVNINDELVLEAQTERSQLKNKTIVVERFHKLIENALKPKKRRIASKPSRASIEKRIRLKKEKSERKRMRRDDKKIGG